MERIALCLSGGGFRATLFHLGVVKQLSESGELSRVRIVTAVSGGSILAAHMALNWDSYLQGGSALDRMVREVIDFAQRDVRGRLVRRWLLAPILFPVMGSKVFRRISLLEAEYSRLYRGSDLRVLGPANDSRDRPNFFLLGTSMTSGDACAFSSVGIEKRETQYERQMFPLARAVAASSAFPPLFPPVTLTRDDLDQSPAKFPHNFECISDGGIFDNLGIRWVLERTSRDFDRVILCDASAPLGWNVESRFSSLVTRTVRATDILMRRVVDLEGKARPEYIDLQGVRTDLVSIKFSGSGRESHHKEIHTRIPLIRTDLNAFTDSEVRLLMQHGHAVASQVLGNDADGIYAERDQDPDISESLLMLKRARGNPIGLWNAKDWASYMLWGVYLAPAVAILLAYVIAVNTIESQNAANSMLNASLQEAQVRSETLQAQVEQRDKVIRELERRVADPAASAPTRSGLLNIGIQVGEHVHFIGASPDTLRVRLERGSAECEVRRECAVLVPEDPRWGTLFVAEVPGNYLLYLENTSDTILMIRVAPHEPNNPQLKADNETFSILPGARIEYRVVVAGSFPPLGPKAGASPRR